MGPSWVELSWRKICGDLRTGLRSWSGYLLVPLHGGWWFTVFWCLSIMASVDFFSGNLCYIDLSLGLDWVGRSLVPVGMGES